MALLTPEYLQTKTYAAQRDRLLYSSLLQEGVVSALDFDATQRPAGANMSVDIAAGEAWVQGDDVVRQGLYHVVNDGIVNVGTQLSGAAWPAGDPANNRLDQVVLQANDTTDGGRATDVPVLGVVIGTPTSGATLDNRSGAAALPPSCMRIADVLIPFGTGQALTANIRDRRPWARGAFRRILRNSGNYTQSGATAQAIDATNLSPRIECSGVMLRASLRGQMFHSASNNGIPFTLRVDGNVADANDLQMISSLGGAGDFRVIEWEFLPAAGSHVIAPYWRVGTGTATLVASAAAAAQFTIEEVVRQDADNS